MFSKLNTNAAKKEIHSVSLPKYSWKNILLELFEFVKFNLLEIRFRPRPKFNEVKARLYFIREDFYELYSPKTTQFFRNEWNLIYTLGLFNLTRFLNFLNEPQKNLYIYLYSRSQNLKNKFNFGVVNENGRNNLRSYNNVLWGFISVWQALRIWVFSLVFFVGFFYLLLLKRTAILPQTLFFWVGFSMLLYWLLSGFVFFVKKYQFSRYTSVIQRFWRRTYILFWLIESCLLLVFFYLVINSSQESFYMFDQGYFLKSHLFSWRIFLFKAILVVALIVYSYLLLLNLKWSTFNKNIFFLTIMTTLLLYFVWLEFYQIYWVSNFYANFSWMYDFEDAIWSLEWDARRTRILNHYIMILFILKFWHIVFIFACWVFFLLRSNELDTITYPLYSFNVQNFLILFIMMWLFMYPWIKHTFHWLSELPYFWFYVDIHVSFYKIFVYDLYWFYCNVITYLNHLTLTTTFALTDFINWALFDTNLDQNVFIKTTIKDLIVKQLV